MRSGRRWRVMLVAAGLTGLTAACQPSNTPDEEVNAAPDIVPGVDPAEVPESLRDDTTNVP